MLFKKMKTLTLITITILIFVSFLAKYKCPKCNSRNTKKIVVKEKRPIFGMSCSSIKIFCKKCRNFSIIDFYHI